MPEAIIAQAGRPSDYVILARVGSRNRRIFIALLWFAFICIGAFHSIVAPMWDGFDEPGHLAYILYIDDHGRVPGYTELSFPTFFLAANRYLPSAVGVGAPSFAQWHSMSQRDRDRFRSEADRLSRDPDRYRIYASSNYQRQQGALLLLPRGEGWYLDETRTFEAAVVAAIAAVSIDWRRAARVLLVTLALANVLGIALLLLPHWAGRSGYTINRRVYIAAMEAMPVRLPAVLPLLILMLALGAIAVATARLSPRPADAPSAPADNRAPYTSTARSDRLHSE